jgi:short-subunit dehydrogenase
MVVITGASKGIGKAVAVAFASIGKKVLICSRSEANLLETAADIKNQYPEASILWFAADLSIRAEVMHFAQWCLQQGTPEVLVNNAGIYLPGTLMDEAEGNMEEIMNLNFFSAYHLTRQLVPSMKEAGKGHVFNICSTASLDAYEGGGSYSVSKYALNGFSKNLRHELKNCAVKVTAVFPGPVHTDSWAGFDNSEKRIMETTDISSMILAATQLSKQAVVEEIIIRPQLGNL